MATKGSSEKWHFSQEEIRAKLEQLGYYNIPDKALSEFSSDLHKLVSSESTSPDIGQKDTSSSTSTTFDSPATSITDQSVHVVEDERITAYKKDIPTSFSNDESSFKQSPITEHYNPYAASTLADKENKVNHPSSLRMTQKRKVLRRKNGKAHVFDESFSQENATDISDIEKRLQKLPLKDDNHYGSIDNDHLSDSSSVLQPCEKNRNALPSFIRPRTADARIIRKADPVNRYHQFKQDWTSNKVPGEKKHKSLRWTTREKMLQYDSFEKPRHRYVPNNYVAPTQKKRQALRWEVRSMLANC